MQFHHINMIIPTNCFYCNSTQLVNTYNNVVECIDCKSTQRFLLYCWDYTICVENKYEIFWVDDKYLNKVNLYRRSNRGTCIAILPLSIIQDKNLTADKIEKLLVLV
jgi:hypothetical protein